MSWWIVARRRRPSPRRRTALDVDVVSDACSRLDGDCSDGDVVPWKGACDEPANSMMLSSACPRQLLRLARVIAAPFRARGSPAPCVCGRSVDQPNTSAGSRIFDMPGWCVGRAAVDRCILLARHLANTHHVRRAKAAHTRSRPFLRMRAKLVVDFSRFPGTRGLSIGDTCSFNYFGDTRPINACLR